jgi:hypothetical protein
VTEPEGFDTWWCFWREHKRHTDGRGKCRKEYQRQLNNGATPEDLLLAAQWHVRNTKDMAFIPLAATWLNSEAWMDEADRERAFQARQAERSENVVNIRTPKSKWLQEWEASKREA